MWNKKTVQISESRRTETVIAILEAVEILNIRMNAVRQIKIEAIESGYLPPIWSSYHVKMLNLLGKFLSCYTSHKYMNHPMRQNIIRRKAVEIADETGCDREEIKEILASLMSPYV